MTAIGQRPMWWKAPMGSLEIVGIVEGGVRGLMFRPQAQSDPWMTSAGHLTSWNIQIRAVMTIHFVIYNQLLMSVLFMSNCNLNTF